MKFSIPIISSILLFFILSCSNTQEKFENYSHEEYLKSIIEDSLLFPGVGIGKLKIEQTRGEFLFNEHINGNAYINRDIHLQYRDSDTLIGISIYDNRIYITPEGKKIGMNKDDVIKELGEPKSYGTSFHNGNGKKGSVSTLNYEGMSILFNGRNERSIFIFKEDE